MAMIQDPKLAAAMGQNPQAQAMMASAQAHVMEHVAFQYRKEIEKMLGASLPPMATDDNEHTLPPEIEVQLSQLAAQAAAKLLQKDTAEAQAQQAQQQAQDPLIQMQQQELQIKAKEVEIKEKKLAAETAAKADEIRLREKEMENKQELEGTKLGIQVAKAKDDAERADAKDGIRIGMEIAQAKMQNTSERKVTK
jgi:hypothetical protein